MEASDQEFEAAVPDPADCQGPDDVGKLRHDEQANIWYECMYDDRRQIYTWVIIPPAD